MRKDSRPCIIFKVTKGGLGKQKVRTRDLKLGDLVLKEIRAPVQDANEKFKQNWANTYIIKQIYSGRVVRLMDLDANPFTKPTNMDQLKKYHI